MSVSVYFCCSFPAGGVRGRLLLPGWAGCGHLGGGLLAWTPPPVTTSSRARPQVPRTAPCQGPGVSYPVIALCDGDSDSECVGIYLNCVSTSRSIETSHYDENTLNMIDIVKKITLSILDFTISNRYKIF